MATNPMYHVTVSHIHVVSPREVVLSVDLNNHVHLYNPAVVQYGMDDFLRQHIDMEAWTAVIADHWLHVTVIGTIDQEQLSRFV